MALTPIVRKATLVSHVTASVGWFGAVAAFLVLAVAGLRSVDSEVVRASYVSMNTTTWMAIVPLCIAALVTGLIQSLGTSWGLFKHYWVVVKLLLTGAATAILLAHTAPISSLAQASLTGQLLSDASLYAVRVRLIGDASAALFVLFAATVLSIYKPWGMTSYGLRCAAVTRSVTVSSARPSARYLLWAAILFVVLIALLHLTGVVGMHH